MRRFSERVTAIHEAGHVVAYCHFTRGIHTAEPIETGAANPDSQEAWQRYIRRQ